MALFPTIPTPAAPSRAPAANSLVAPFLPDLDVNWLGQPGPQWPIDASGDIGLAEGYRAWVNGWIVELLTQQNAYPIYPRRFGLDHESHMALQLRPEVEAAYTAQIQKKAAQDGMTRAVRAFRYAWSEAGELTLSFEAVAITGESVQMEIQPYV